MLVKKIIPFKFLSAILSIAVAGVLLGTKNAYPTLNSTSQTSFIIGCIMIILFLLFQIIMTIIGVNIYDVRVNFQNMIFNFIAMSFLIWFGMALWQRQYIWYIWGFLIVYPTFNELIGLISIVCHNKKIVFEKYRSDS